MHPVLVTIPGALVKLVAPALILWGLYSLVVAALRARLRPAPAGAGDAPDPTGDDAGGGLLARLPGDSPANALVTLAIGVGLFVYSAPVAIPDGAPFARLARGAGAVARALATGATWGALWNGIPIYSYGVMLGLSLVVGWKLTLSLTDRQGLARERMAECYVVTAAAAVLGSRVLYIATNLHEFRDPITRALSPAAMVSLRTGGLVAYGGFLGGLVGSAAYLARHRVSLWKWADAAVPSLATGLAITRIGCYLYGCDFGKPLGSRAPGFLQRAGTFPHWHDDTGSPAWLQHVALGFRADAATCEQRFRGYFRDGLCQLDRAARASAPVHPTQLYESAVGLLLFVALMAVWRRRRFDGQVFLAFGVLYGAARAALEVIRDDRERGFVAGWSTSQVIGVTTAAACAALYVARRRKGIAPV